MTKCPLGLCKVSVIPPTALNSIDSDGRSSMAALVVGSSCGGGVASGSAPCIFPEGAGSTLLSGGAWSMVTGSVGSCRSHAHPDVAALAGWLGLLV